MKCQYLLLMNKLTAIKKEKEGQVLVMQLFMKTWTRFMDYWVKVRPRQYYEVIEIVSNRIRRI